MSTPLAQLLFNIKLIFENVDEVTLDKDDFIRILKFKNVPDEYVNHYLENGYDFIRGKKIKCKGK